LQLKSQAGWAMTDFNHFKRNHSVQSRKFQINRSLAWRAGRSWIHGFRGKPRIQQQVHSAYWSFHGDSIAKDT
jgi:hypothetical protein